MTLLGLIVGPVVTVSSAEIGDNPPQIAPTVPQFVEHYCMDCHNEEEEKGDRAFASFLAHPNDPDFVIDLEDMLDQLNLGEMPPLEKKKEPQRKVRQPTDAERQLVVAEITHYLDSVNALQQPEAAVLRRLTRTEYNNTLRDLIGAHPKASDATRQFPLDQHVDGFTNVGSGQMLSDYQLRLYMQTARRYLDQVLEFDQPRPQPQKWVFKPKDFNAKEHDPGTVAYRVWAPDFSYFDIGHGQPVERYTTYPKNFSQQGTPVSGTYRLSVRATAVGRENPYNPAIFENDLSMPLKLGIWHAPNSALLSQSASQGRVLLGTFDLPDDAVEEFEVTTWMPAGSRPFINWMNGVFSKPVLQKTIAQHHPEAVRKSQTMVDSLIEQGLPVPEDALVQKIWISDLYQGPRLRVFEMTLEGPIDPEWPSAGHRRLVGETTDATKVDIPSTFTTFASRAYRRPVATSEVSHYIAFVQQHIADGMPAAEAIKLGLSAVLSSPRFLFLDEGNAEDGTQLDDYELASRLSYALWNSMPDDALMEVAAQGQMRDPEVLRRETERLLQDPRAESFHQTFLDAWLRLDKIGSMPPSNAQYPTYYYERLDTAMKVETRMFFAHMLRENRPVTDFLDADYTFVNDALAKHYGLSGTFGEAFQKVTLPAERRRAGVLGHASVLTATANGIETSPVVRGVWVLESILGTPPSPPPPDVPPIEPDTRGATTIREQLAKHRNATACADCHAKIDPWGFPLEFFDPIGGLRTHYPVFSGEGRIARRQQGKPVDGSGELPSGERIEDESDLRRALLSRKDQFTRNLVDKLLTYTTGRTITFRDHHDVDRIVKQVAEDGYGLHNLVLRVMTSETVQRR